MAGMVFLCKVHNANQAAQQAQRMPGLYCRTRKALPHAG